MDSKYNDDVFLYGSTGKAIALTDLPQYVERRLADNKTVVLYIHGRGAEPNKSLHEKGIVEKIEQQHGVECIMFSWDSEAGGGFLGKLRDRERPLKHVPRGADKLAEVLRAFSTVNRISGKIVLLVHSMGSIVLQEALTKPLWPATLAPIFDKALLTEPDADEKGHAIWLDALCERVSGGVYVTFNGNDNILKHSTEKRPKGTHALGLGPEDSRSGLATYINATGLAGKSHRLFALGALDNQVALATVVRSALRGESVDLGPANGQLAENIFAPTDHKDPLSPIFAGVAPHTDMDDE
jgi:hypothetical protein